MRSVLLGAVLALVFAGLAGCSDSTPQQSGVQAPPPQNSGAGKTPDAIKGGGRIPKAPPK